LPAAIRGHAARPSRRGILGRSRLAGRFIRLNGLPPSASRDGRDAWFIKTSQSTTAPFPPLSSWRTRRSLTAATQSRCTGRRWVFGSPAICGARRSIIWAA
jgi:hypothetical protein